MRYSTTIQRPQHFAASQNSNTSRDESTFRHPDSNPDNLTKILTLPDDFRRTDIWHPDNLSGNLMTWRNMTSWRPWPSEALLTTTILTLLTCRRYDEYRRLGEITDVLTDLTAWLIDWYDDTGNTDVCPDRPDVWRDVWSCWLTYLTYQAWRLTSDCPDVWWLLEASDHLTSDIPLTCSSLTCGMQHTAYGMSMQCTAYGVTYSIRRTASAAGIRRTSYRMPRTAYGGAYGIQRQAPGMAASGIWDAWWNGVQPVVDMVHFVLCLTLTIMTWSCNPNPNPNPNPNLAYLDSLWCISVSPYQENGPGIYPGSDPYDTWVIRNRVYSPCNNYGLA
jgi:hypothetical protein